MYLKNENKIKTMSRNIQMTFILCSSLPHGWRCKVDNIVGCASNWRRWAWRW
jgi:hypothetical protein